ncbi:asparagine synthase (glutamine-hydrolyzing) [Cecembia lonarensis]|uniref:asparagine synthase (glutamine-hydrolyzing) n=1 Tax=Cecembia lonarensis (strain CCUG 58316 / KCTC 22772 / LW9) TaxID=1225176 RepID=K1L4J4_CECL9|nr:asparagine synthase (glutamine-hydrolyzing) [Cecembia lonarensis]EKB51330.1 Asparagine synthetase (glutamine-hydrolyzing) 1 [Cecembia lonarensis LW9]
MCGILGSINLPINGSILDLIKHRGPDDSGLEVFQFADNHVYFGHRRLSILDLSAAGHQPMISNDGRYALIFNGEIYNHEDLRQKIKSPINYKGHSDTETILYYLIEFGFDAIADLNGIFALAFYAINNGQLYLARDHFGVKPLYYALDAANNTLLFSSEIRPIKQSNKENDLNMPALGSLLRLRYNAAPYTLYEDIEKVRPGHYLKFNLSEKLSECKQVAFLKPIPLKKKFTDKDQAIEKYGEFFERAVQRQLQSDVPIGVLLSGGIDSAMVASVAQKYSNYKLKAFTVGFEGVFDEDEIEQAAQTAEFLGLEHHYKKIDFSDFLSVMKKCSKIVEEPLATTSMIPMYFLSDLASKHVKVVMTGQGADEPLGGYTKYKAEIIQQKIPNIAQNFIGGFLKNIPTKNEKLQRGLQSLGIKDELDRFISTYEIFSNQEIYELIACEDRLSRDLLAYFYKILQCEKIEHPVERMMAIDARMNLADDLLNYTDKITMNFALECRVPILDHELIQFIESLPMEYRLNLKEGKLIHKAYAKSLLPTEIITRKKKAFKSPTNYWFKNESTILKSILLDNGSVFSRIFNLNKVNQLISLQEKGHNKEKQIFLLLGIYYFLENFEIKKS